MEIKKLEVRDIVNKLLTDGNKTHEDIASSLGVTSMTIYNWSKGKAKPKSRIIINALNDLYHTDN